MPNLRLVGVRFAAKRRNSVRRSLSLRCGFGYHVHHAGAIRRIGLLDPVGIKESRES